MTQTDTRAMLQTAFLTAIVVVLFLLGSTVPFLGFLGTIVAPATLGFIGVRWGARYAILGGILSLLLLGGIFGMWATSMVAIPFVFLGIASGVVLHLKWSYGRQIVIPALAFMVGMGVTVGLSMAIMNVNMVDTFQNLSAQVQDEMVQTYGQMGLEPAQQSAMISQVKQSFDFIKGAFLAFGFAIASFYAYLVRMITGWGMKRFSFEPLPFLSVGQWQMPKWSAYLLVLGWIGQYWGSKYSLDVLAWVVPNLVILGAALCLVQGIASFWYVLGLYRLDPKLRILALIIIGTFMSQGLIILGLVDILFDLRRRLYARMNNRR